jgi:hypothetical protein
VNLLADLWTVVTLLLLPFVTARTEPAKIEAVVSIKVIKITPNNGHSALRFVIKFNKYRTRFIIIG